MSYDLKDISPTGAVPIKTETPIIKPKAAGETQVVAVMGGDYGHNSIPLEMHIRNVFDSEKSWRILFVPANDSD